MQENPDLIIQELQKLAAERGKEVPKPPPDPGPMPEADEFGNVDAKAFADWTAKREALLRYETKQLLSEQRQEIESRLEPVLTRDQRMAALEREALIRQHTQADDDTFAQMKAVADSARKDPMTAWSLIKEVVSLRKQLAGTAAATKKKINEQIRGSEERSGLPGTGARKPRPRPTGNFVKDIDAELKADGIEFPEGE